jgi:hypothetical protein
MFDVRENNGLGGKWMEIFVQLAQVSASTILHRGGFITVPAWIPGLRIPLRSCSARDDELHFLPTPISNAATCRNPA